MVGLRTATHMHSYFHYIRAIKNGSTKVVVNVDAKGKSKLKFRQVVDVYNQDSVKEDALVPRVVRDLDNGSDDSCSFSAEVGIQTETEDFSMTLESVRKQCKAKKRKRRQRSVSEIVSDIEVKQELLTEDEGCGVEEPLINWNTKVSKRRKKECKSLCVSTSLSETSVDLSLLLCELKPEAWEDSYSVPTVALLDCNQELESSTSSELVDRIMCDSSKDTRLAPCCGVEPNSLEMVATKELVAPEPVEESVIDASEEFSNVLCDNVSSEETELEVPQNLESEDSDCVKNLIASDTCTGCEEVKEDGGSSDSKPNLDMAITGLEIVKVEAPEILASDYSSEPIMDSGIENSKVVWETEDLAKDDLPEAIDITSCCNSLDKLHLVPDDSTVSLEEHQLPKRLQEQDASSGHVDDQKSPQLYEVTTDTESDSIHQQKQHNQPEKLLSGRKALSPTSQAKLRKAMEQPDSPEKKSKKSKGKLYFSSQTSHRILKAEGLDNIDRVEVIPNSKQAIQKANNNTRQMQSQRATRKFPRRDTQGAKPQPFGTGSTSLQGCTQKAISFSQGQMRDFQFVAARLTKELKSMRQVTKRCLLAESNMSESNFDEMKILIGNAEKTEENSKKWISIIERDCNRFCKLMGMVNVDSPVIENSVEKKKKIKFADDAGGDLCQVKVFEIDLESEL